MNTPAHALINLALLARITPAAAVLAVLAGGLLPDLPMLVFYAVQKLGGVAEAEIWSTAYFAPQWQAFFDVPNSLVLIALGAGWAAWARRPIWLLLFASMALHGVADLLLHHDDGHRHFWPLSEFRFSSPVSYWDPAHSGWLVLPVEIALSCLATVWAWRRYPQRRNRVALASLVAVYLGFMAFAAVVWGPLGQSG